MILLGLLTKSEVLANEGFWAMAHGSRTDWSMLLGSLFFDGQKAVGTGQSTSGYIKSIAKVDHDLTQYSLFGTNIDG